jgi:hypothetical protein
MMNRSRDLITTTALLVLAASAPVRRLRMNDGGHHPVTASERSRMS